MSFKTCQSGRTYEIITSHGVYIIDADFVDLVRGKRSLFRFFSKPVDDEMLVRWAIEENKVKIRYDLGGCYGR